MERSRDTHDLFHILTGYGRDALGEQCVLLFTHGQSPSSRPPADRLCRGVSISRQWPRAATRRFSALCGRRIAPVRVRPPPRLIEQSIRELLAQPLEAVRAQLKHPAPTQYRECHRIWRAEGIDPYNLLASEKHPAGIGGGVGLVTASWRICASGFLTSAFAGTVASGTAWPATTIITGFSHSGRSQISRRKPIGEGVWVSVANPASCRVAKQHSAGDPDAFVDVIVLRGPVLGDPALALREDDDQPGRGFEKRLVGIRPQWAERGRATPRSPSVHRRPFRRTAVPRPRQLCGSRVSFRVRRPRRSARAGDWHPMARCPPARMGASITSRGTGASENHRQVRRILQTVFGQRAGAGNSLWHRRGAAGRREGFRVRAYEQGFDLDRQGNGLLTDINVSGTW